ncbi:MAG: hypothetical protein QM528_06040, partial [Phycisphaerales bacterium]|nr:hypothetical protein [Phycisphaerales bacterium]
MIFYKVIFLSFVLIQKKETKKKSSLQSKGCKTTALFVIENEWHRIYRKRLVAIRYYLLPPLRLLHRH